LCFFGLPCAAPPRAVMATAGEEAENEDDPGAYDVAKWSPSAMQYGLFHLLIARELMPKMLEKPIEIATLKFADSRVINLASAPPQPMPPADDDDSDDDGGEDVQISEGEPAETTEQVSWPKKRGAWWRVHERLPEDVLVRSGVSLASSEVRRIAPGELVQQAGAARALTGGRARGCIRLPVFPNGWVTADATRAGGPRYLVRAGVPKWKVVYTSPTSSSTGDVIIRSEKELDSEAVHVLYNGDVVEQAGPALNLLDEKFEGILRMPVTAIVRRRGNGADDVDSDGMVFDNAKALGWVTVDASAQGGPVFLKLLPDTDAKRRRRKNGGFAAS